MSEAVSVQQAAALLSEADNIVLLLHRFPDGDTIGCGYALAYALRALDKAVRVECADPIPEKYAYINTPVLLPEFPAEFVCAVDVADPKLLGHALAHYADAVDLCIDHHGSNTGYAKKLCLDATCGAACMIVMQIIEALGVELDAYLASALYTGIATDTGCFKYGNTSALAHRQAATLIEYGADYAHINRIMFDIKSRQRLELERRALEGIRFYEKDRVAIMTVTEEMIAASGATENDMEGLAPLPRQIEGVWVGITMRQRADGAYKVSLRTGDRVNASEVCGLLGGGGHAAAAGCTLGSDTEQSIAALLDAIRTVVPQIGE